MDFSKFVEKAILYDRRNTFSKYDGNLDGVPDILKDLYRDSNPIDVEFNNIRFFPVEELIDLQAEYSYMNAQFIFATCNGDPIFLHDGCIYTAPHGVKETTWELLSATVEEYFTKLL